MPGSSEPRYDRWRLYGIFWQFHHSGSDGIQLNITNYTARLKLEFDRKLSYGRSRVEKIYFAISHDHRPDTGVVGNNLSK
jgi:hypothetical protein